MVKFQSCQSSPVGSPHATQTHHSLVPGCVHTVRGTLPHSSIASCATGLRQHTESCALACCANQALGRRRGRTRGSQESGFSLGPPCIALDSVGCFAGILHSESPFIVRPVGRMSPDHRPVSVGVRRG